MLRHVDRVERVTIPQPAPAPWSRRQNNKLGSRKYQGYRYPGSGVLPHSNIHTALALQPHSTSSGEANRGRCHTADAPLNCNTLF